MNLRDKGKVHLEELKVWTSMDRECSLLMLLNNFQERLDDHEDDLDKLFYGDCPLLEDDIK